MDPLPDKTTEMILGLDPRALLERVQSAKRRPVRAPWLPPPVEELAPLLPSFVVESLIGRGGMGAVYRARQPALDRAVAIKLLPWTDGDDAEFAERFRTEARALARLQHPHIVTIYECGEMADGHLYYVMEYVDGSDLSERLARGPLPAAEALKIARAVCEALEYAHARGIIHRDIKPANVLLGSDGSVKVADFGLAKQFGAAVSGSTSGVRGSDATLTLTGAALGTPSYMSPEQRAGREVDGRTDLYSLGMMLYEMLTGQLPEGAWRPPSRRADSSARLDAVVEESLQSDPAERVPSAAAFRTRLERVQRSMNPAARWRRILFAAGAGIVLCSAGAWLWPRSAATPSDAGTIPPSASSGSSTGSADQSFSPSGVLTPFSGLDLSKAAISGNWHWLDGKPGDTVAIPPRKPGSAPATLLLPVQPGSRAFDLSCEVLLEEGGSINFVFPAGHARVAFVFDLYDNSGFELVRGRDWKNNATSVVKRMDTGRFMSVAITVRPQGDRVALSMTLDGKPYTRWEGPQADLTIGRDDAQPYLVSQPDPFFALSTITGAIRVRDLKVTIHP